MLRQTLGSRRDSEGSPHARLAQVRARDGHPARRRALLRRHHLGRGARGRRRALRGASRCGERRRRRSGGGSRRAERGAPASSCCGAAFVEGPVAIADDGRGLLLPARGDDAAAPARAHTPLEIAETAPSPTPGRLVLRRGPVAIADRPSPTSGRGEAAAFHGARRALFLRVAVHVAEAYS